MTAKQGILPDLYASAVRAVLDNSIRGKKHHSPLPCPEGQHRYPPRPPSDGPGKMRLADQMQELQVSLVLVEHVVDDLLLGVAHQVIILAALSQIDLCTVVAAVFQV